MYGKVSRSSILSFLSYIDHGVAAICQFVEIRDTEVAERLSWAQPSWTGPRWQGVARLYRCPFPHQLDRQAIQHLPSLTEAHL
jgi:hypothetical protein